MALGSSYNMISGSIIVVTVLAVFAICLPNILTEKVNFRCDELEDKFIYDNVFCTVTSFDVNHTTQVDCDVYRMERTKIRVIKFYTSRMLYVPAGLFRYFSEVRDLDISDSQIIDIPRNTFEGANHLVYLKLSHNNLTELRASIFMEATTLFVVDLSFNQISKIDKFAFADARSLSRLNLSNNRLTALDPDLFKDITFLDQLFVNDNYLFAIDTKMFTHTVMLQWISLDNNYLTELNTSTFRQFNYLEKLQVSGNHLQHIDVIGFPGKFRLLSVNNNNLTELRVENVEHVEAANNKIRSISFGSPLTMKTLTISNNSLTDISNITSLSNLEVLDISYNRVGKINITTFTKLRNLVNLNLANTSLAELNFGSFSAQTELKSLDISYNSLYEVHLDVFSPYLEKLEKLHLDGNGLTEVGGIFQIDLAQVFQRMTTLGISNNNFNCTYLTKLFRLINTMKIKLPVDPDLSAVNTTHVFGIACSNDRPLVLETEHVPFVHFDYRRSSDNPSDDKDMLNAMLEYEDRNAVNRNEENRVLRIRASSAEMHEELLRSNLMTMKVVICIACFVGFVVVSMKCITFYRKNKDMLHINPSLYRSTTTMNTLQCSLEQASSN